MLDPCLLRLLLPLGQGAFQGVTVPGGWEDRVLWLWGPAVSACVPCLVARPSLWPWVLLLGRHLANGE